MPDLTPAELTKYAMGKYKAIFSNQSASNETNGKATSSAKRKINTEDTNEQSGIAKLAKFQFSK